MKGSPNLTGSLSTGDNQCLAQGIIKAVAWKIPMNPQKHMITSLDNQHSSMGYDEMIKFFCSRGEVTLLKG